MTLGSDEDWNAQPPARPTPEPPPASAPSPSGPGLPPAARWATAVAGIVALLVGIWFVSARLPGWITQPDPASGTVTGDDVGVTGEARTIQATLFYVDDSGTRLVPTSHNVVYGATTVEQARRLVEAQVAAPPQGQISPIPAGTTVRNVFLSDRREAYVDLGGGVVQNHPGGSLNEALTVYAIVNVITTNLPDIDAVQILIDGHEVDTLGGHIDLRAPLWRGADWIQKGTPAP